MADDKDDELHDMDYEAYDEEEEEIMAGGSSVGSYTTGRMKAIAWTGFCLFLIVYYIV